MSLLRDSPALQRLARHISSSADHAPSLSPSSSSALCKPSASCAASSGRRPGRCNCVRIVGDDVRLRRLLLQAREQPPALGDFRRALHRRARIDLRFIEAAQVHQDLRAREQRRRKIGISAARFVEQRERAFLLVEIAVLRRDREQQRNRYAIQRALRFHQRVQGRRRIERAQARDEFGHHRRLARRERCRAQGEVARGAIVARERMRRRTAAPARARRSGAAHAAPGNWRSPAAIPSGSHAIRPAARADRPARRRRVRSCAIRALEAFDQRRERIGVAAPRADAARMDRLAHLRTARRRRGRGVARDVDGARHRRTARRNPSRPSPSTADRTPSPRTTPS